MSDEHTTPSTFDRRRLLQLGAITAGALTLGRSWPAVAGEPLACAGRVANHGAEVPLAWFDLARTLVQTTPGFSPPVAARAFGYTGVALYEALLPGMPGHKSLAGQLDGLTRRPAPRRGAGHLHWPLVANAALAGILRRLFPGGSDAMAAIDALEGELAATIGADVARHLVRRSRRHGENVAEAIFAWSTDDGGHEGYLRNTSSSYVPPVGPGLWQPTPPAFAPALQPYWGGNRTMIPGLAAAAMGAPPLPYSEDPASAFHAEAKEVYETVNGGSEEQRAIAHFWSDDPGRTATPAGHSISILSQVLAAQGANLELAAEAYARLGIALSDAFVCCWATKYHHNLLRPITYIRVHLDPAWGDPLPLTTPPFPEHTSGHSVQSGAAARVLTALLGPVAFTDHTHDGRGLAPRSFASFDEAAAEAANSRLYGGIHYRRAIEEGLRQGALVGDAVNRLRLTGLART